MRHDARFDDHGDFGGMVGGARIIGYLPIDFNGGYLSSCLVQPGLELRFNHWLVGGKERGYPPSVDFVSDLWCLWGWLPQIFISQVVFGGNRATHVIASERATKSLVLVMTRPLVWEDDELDDMANVGRIECVEECRRRGIQDLK